MPRRHASFLAVLICLVVMLAEAAPAVELTIPHGIVESARSGDYHAVHKLLERDPELAETTDAHGYTALQWACIRGHWHIVDELLGHGADPALIGGDGGTTLHWAGHHDAPAVLARLIDAGADPQHKNQWGRAPLHVAARRGCAGNARLLIERGVDLHATTHEGWTPLHVAHRAGQPEMVALLLEAGADPDRRDSEGQRPEDMHADRPQAIDLSPERLDEYAGHYDLGPGYGFKIWREGDALHIREFAPDGLYPIGEDDFHCVQEPWRVTFTRDDAGRIDGVDVAFLRQTIHGQKRADHPHYVGSAACRECHIGREHGSQYVQWASSRHGAAYWRLATEWAKLLAAFRPQYRDITAPIEEDRCLQCHVTGAQDDEGLFEVSFDASEGVGCETCHGPGSLYMDVEVMEDREAFLTAGGIVPDERTCRMCHRNPERFDFGEWWPKVTHALPTESSHH